jgi:WD40 repeat protein
MEFQEGFIQTGNFETIKFDYTEFMSGADFYNDFNYIVSSSTDHILKIYKSQNNEILKEYSEIESISDNKSSVWSFLDFNEEYFITGNFDGLIKFWSKERYETDIILSGHTKKVNKLLKFDKNTLLSCSDDSTIKIWSVNDKECVASLTDHEGKVNDIIIIDENHILSCSEDRTLRLWNLENVECVQVVSTKNIENCLCKLSDDKILVGGKDNYIKIYDIDLEYVDMFKAHDDEVLVIKENKNGDIISGGKEHLVKIFNANSLECKKVLQGHNNSIINIYEKDDKIISASVDRTIKIWTI